MNLHVWVDPIHHTYHCVPHETLCTPNVVWSVWVRWAICVSIISGVDYHHLDTTFMIHGRTITIMTSISRPCNCVIVWLAIKPYTNHLPTSTHELLCCWTLHTMDSTSVVSDWSDWHYMYEYNHIWVWQHRNVDVQIEYLVLESRHLVWWTISWSHSSVTIQFTWTVELCSLGSARHIFIVNLGQNIKSESRSTETTNRLDPVCVVALGCIYWSQ